MESSAVFTDVANQDQRNSKDDYFCISTGLEYTLKDFYFFIEYYFNGAGSENSDEYHLILDKPGFKDGNVYLLGKHYVITNTDYQITPFLNAGLKIVFNVNDHSLLVYPEFQYAFTDNVEIKGGYYINIGEITSVDMFGTPLLHSEFGTYPHIGFINIFIYF
jgi:hypothetical protein